MPDPLIATHELCAQLGLSPRTVQRYVKAGIIEPAMTTAGGHYRWDPNAVREQLAAYQRSKRDQ